MSTVQVLSGFRRMGLLLFIVLLFIFPATADQVVFKNGRTLDCTIEAVHPDTVEISLGTGSMSIPRNQLLRIERTDPAVKKDDKEDWQKGNILSAQHAPAAHAELAAEFRKLMVRRNAALDGKYMMSVYERKTRELESLAKKLNDKIEVLDEEITVLRKQIGDIKLPAQLPRKNSAIYAYNKLVHKKQILQEQANSIMIEMEPLVRKRTEALEKLPDIKSRHKLAMQPIPVYQKELELFSSTYAAQKPAKNVLQEMPKARTLFEKMDRYLARFNREFSTDRIAARQVDDSTIVEVLVNGTFTGEFILDTGATGMTISESFAKQLGLQLDALPKTKIVVADGSIVDVKEASLISVSVGESEVKDVAVVIIADSPNLAEDGLLGMAFLKHFSITINGTTGELELTRFQP